MIEIAHNPVGGSPPGDPRCGADSDPAVISIESCPQFGGRVTGGGLLRDRRHRSATRKDQQQ